ncbi:MAG: hypothetical protein CMK74_11720 [Pseudomonadales bacterium]|mgnify:CR=1 FL=1|jgi:hypothetical protein|nr:hypothetical protein [Pseudomonadales bacterium]|tara:strand:- start:4028 stop:4471 length:444 start_codon:yes stop_codon:yes gene_type:complete
MQNETRKLSPADMSLLTWAADHIAASDLLELVNDSVQWGPAPTLKGPLYKISRRAIHPVAWNALIELKSWGGGSIADDAEQYNELLIADAALLELILLAIRRLIDALMGQAERDADAATATIATHQTLAVRKNRQRLALEDQCFELR